MKTVDYYLDKAREKTGAESDRQLAKILKINASSLAHWRTKRSWPSDDNIITLAAMSGDDPAIAVLELGSWRSANGATQMVYKSLIQKLTGVLSAVVIMLLCMSSNAKADVLRDGTINHEFNQSIHYHTFRYFFRKLKSHIVVFLHAFCNKPYQMQLS